MTDFKEGDRVTVITAPPPSPEATELAVTICRNNTEGIALALDRFAAAARERALEEAAKIADDEEEPTVDSYTGRERENGARWRDKKSGSTYIEIGRARLRCFNTDTLADRVVIYRAYEDGSLWVRPVWEFEDGRFELLPERSEPSPSAQSPAPDTVIVERAIMMLNDREIVRLRAALDEAVKVLGAIIEEEDLDGVRIITKHALSRIAELTEA